MSKTPPEYCYLCDVLLHRYEIAPGASPPDDHRTRDHVPPEGLFPDPKPTNLITVPCCYRCNRSFSKLDEQFRAIVSMAANVSGAGTDIMRTKVFDRSLKKSPKLKSQIGQSIFPGTLQTPHGPVTGPLIAMDRKDFEPYLIRITKGLLAHLYPQVDYSGLIFSVVQLGQFQADQPRFRDMAAILKYGQRGDGVFRFWHGMAKEEPSSGLWILQFYEAALFLVKHRKGPWPQAAEVTYVSPGSW